MGKSTDNNMTDEEFLSHFSGLNPIGRGRYLVMNPLGDNNPSLEITFDPLRGRRAIKAFNGELVPNKDGKQDNPWEYKVRVLEAVGLTPDSLWYPGATGSQKRSKPWNERTEWSLNNRYKRTDIRLLDWYHYQSIESGEYTYTRLRTTPIHQDKGKDLLYGIYDEKNDKMSTSLGRNETGGKRSRADFPVSAYGSIDKIREGKGTDRIICYAEGEKDVNTILKYGHLAFTVGSAGDAIAWAEKFAYITEGADLVIFSDNDPEGYKSSVAVFKACQKFAKSVKIILPVKDVEKADITDYMKFKTVMAFKQLLNDQDDTEEVFRKAEGTPEENSITEISSTLPVDLTRTAGGQIESTLPNYVKVMKSDGDLGQSIRFNQMSRSIYVRGDLPWKTESESNFRAWADIDRSKLLYYLTEKYGMKNVDLMDHAVNIIADDNAFHPIRELLESLEWDGVKRIDTLLHSFLGARNDWYSAEIMKLIMMGAINRAYHPGSKFDYSVIMIGDQGKGKSTFVRVLTMDDEWEAVLSGRNAFDDVEAAKVIRGKWIIELEEMAIMKKADQDSLKGFLTRQTDRYRDAYTKFAQDFQRSCIFIGTTNRRNFLSDKTGNRRFIPVEVNLEEPEMDFYDDGTTEYIRQAWAEAMQIYRTGEYSLVPRGEFLNEILRLQGLAEEEDPIQEEVEEYIQDKDIVSTGELFAELLKDSEKKNKSTFRILNDIMSNMDGWKRSEKKIKHYNSVTLCYVRTDSDKWKNIARGETPFTE